MRLRHVDETVEQSMPEAVQTLIRVLLGSLSACGPNPLPELRVIVKTLQGSCESVDIVHIAEETVLSVTDKLGRLPDPSGHERDSRRHRFEHRLGPALLAGSDEIRVECLVDTRQLVA
jgi:hypothetical protein